LVYAGSNFPKPCEMPYLKLLQMWAEQPQAMAFGWIYIPWGIKYIEKAPK